MSEHILLVAHDETLAHAVEGTLAAEGYRVSRAADGLSGLIAAREREPDLVLVDWLLSGLSGLELCRRLRQTGSRTPLVLLSPRDDVRDRIEALDAGADDYVLKPLSPEELLLRVRVYIRPHAEAADGKLIFLDLSLDPLTREVSRQDADALRRIDLTAKEFELLRYLMEHPRQVLTRQQILEQVWGDEFTGDSNIIEVYIRYLRLKIERDGEKRLIQTVRGVGYVLRE